MHLVFLSVARLPQGAEALGFANPPHGGRAVVENAPSCCLKRPARRKITVPGQAFDGGHGGELWKSDGAA
jgi:hypothetical protein